MAACSKSLEKYIINKNRNRKWEKINNTKLHIPHRNSSYISEHHCVLFKLKANWYPHNTGSKIPKDVKTQGYSNV